MPAHASATPAHASGTPVAHWHARAHLGASVSRRVGVEQWNTADSLARTRYCLRHTALCAVACCGLLCTMIGSLGHIRTSWHSRTHQDTPAHASATPEHASSTPETSRGTQRHAWDTCGRDIRRPVGGERRRLRLRRGLHRGRCAQPPLQVSHILGRRRATDERALEPNPVIL